MQVISERSASLTLRPETPFRTKANPIAYGKIEVSTPYTYKRYRAKLKGEEDKVAQALAKMAQEDLTIKVVNDGENRQTLLYGMGDQHLDIIASQLLTKYKVDMTLEKPKVAFRETIRKKLRCRFQVQESSPADMDSTDM